MRLKPFDCPSACFTGIIKPAKQTKCSLIIPVKWASEHVRLSIFRGTVQVQVALFAILSNFKLDKLEFPHDLLI